MRVVIQRVSEASVNVNNALISSIGKGLMILVCVESNDTDEDLIWVCKKIVALRIFDDENGVMNLSVKDIGGEILAVSQFTLLASTRKGNRPSYFRAAPPDFGNKMYLKFCKQLEELTQQTILKGIFGADMRVSLINDGPVTIIIDSHLKE